MRQLRFVRLRLAGILEGQPDIPMIPPAIRCIAEEFDELPPDVQGSLLDAWIAMVRAAQAASERHRNEAA